jgi:glycosyltransferase involved in cell wall biosynthesis
MLDVLTPRPVAKSGEEPGILLTVVIPVFNEEQNIAPLVSEIEGMLPAIPGRTEVIFVDDGSSDSSWAQIDALASDRPWLRGLRLLSNRGQTAAMVAGIDAARGEVIGFLDGDLQNDPSDLPKLLEPILSGTSDMVCGWRVARRDQMSRTLASRLANFLIRRSFDLSVHDLGCTLKVCRRVFLQEVQLFGEMHRFIVCYAQAQGARISELGVNHRPRRSGESKYGFDRIGKVLVDLATTKMLNSYGSKPAYFFGKIALLFFLLGTLAFGIVAYRTFILDRPESTPMVFVWLLMYLTALISLMSGLLAEINVRVLHEAGHRRGYRVIESIGDDSGR